MFQSTTQSYSFSKKRPTGRCFGTQQPFSLEGIWQLVKCKEIFTYLPNNRNNWKTSFGG
jgi:hypothetical protein